MMEWQTKTLGEVAKIERGKFSHRPRNEPRFYGGNTPFVQTGDVTRSNGIIRTHTQTLNDDGVAISKVFPAGTILITIAANIGYAGILKFDSAAPDSLIGLTPDDSVSAEFLNFYLRTQQPEMDRVAPKGTQKNINIEFLRPWPVIVPPIPEQKKIAHILSTVQRAIEAQARIIQTTTELKKTLLHKLFTEGLRGEPQKQTEIGPVPESWEVVELATLLREPLRNGHSAKAITDEDGIRTLTLTAVTQRDFSVENTKVTCADPHRVRDMWLKSGDIFIERANTADYVGLAALYEGAEDFAIFPDLLIRVRVDVERLRSKVLIEWLLAEPCRRYYKKNARSTAGNFPKIDQGTVEKTLVPVPSVEEQGELEHAFRTLDDKLNQHTARRSTLQDLFRTLLHQLMTAQMRVHELELTITN